MKNLIMITLILAYSLPVVFGQSDTTKLMDEARTKLSTHSAIASEILSDPVYDPLHASTAFRELIKQYAEQGVLSIANDKEPGEKIKVTVIVKDKNGNPVPGALIYLYQTDSRGWYAADAPHILANEGDFRHARLFGYSKTDKNGQFELHTVKPSGYPQSDLPAHIHLLVMAEGYNVLMTELLFKDDERLKGEALNRAIVDGGIIAKPEATEAPFKQKFSYTLTIKGSN